MTRACLWTPKSNEILDPGDQRPADFDYNENEPLTHSRKVTLTRRTTIRYHSLIYLYVTADLEVLFICIENDMLNK